MENDNKTVNNEELNRISKYLEYYYYSDLVLWHQELIDCGSKNLELFKIIDGEIKRRDNSKTDIDEIVDKLCHFFDDLMDIYNINDIEKCMLLLADAWDLHRLNKKNKLNKDYELLPKNILIEEIKEKMITYVDILDNEYERGIINTCLRGIYDKWSLYKLKKSVRKS